MSQASSGRISHSTASTRAFRSRLNVSATFSQTLLNLGAIVVHGKRKTEVAHLAEVAISCIMARDREVEVSGKSRGMLDEEREHPYRIPTSVADHCSLRVAISLDISVPECTFMRFALYGLYQIFSTLEISIGPYRPVRLTHEIMFAKMRARSSEEGTCWKSIILSHTST